VRDFAVKLSHPAAVHFISGLSYKRVFYKREATVLCTQRGQTLTAGLVHLKSAATPIRAE